MIALIGYMDFVLKEGYVNESTFWGSNQYWNWVIKPEETIISKFYVSYLSSVKVSTNQKTQLKMERENETEDLQEIDSWKPNDNQDKERD